jgi:hypothetical protein
VCFDDFGTLGIQRKSAMPPTAMMMAVMVMDGNKDRETAANTDYGHGENKGGEYLFHGISK